MAREKLKVEWDKAYKDAEKNGLGIMDMKTGTHIDGTNLAFLWPSGKAKKPQKEVVLQRDLITIEKIYKEKFGTTSPYDIQLFNMDVGHFIERLIRATEICTMKYVLNKGGALNKCKATITRGRRKFLWED